MKPKRILVDMDGVLAAYQEHLLAIIAKDHPDLPQLSSHDLVLHDTEKLFPPEHRDTIEAITLEKGFFRSLPPITGGREALEKMVAMGHDVRICTAPKKRYHHCVDEKFRWIDAHLGQYFVERTILTRDKTLVDGDILIDDKPEITGVRTPSWKHVLYDQPYNRMTPKERITWTDWATIIL